MVLAIPFLFVLYRALRRPDENSVAQTILDGYINSSLSPAEIGLRYERYIGFRYEMKGYYVQYNGANNSLEDMGRDLIVRDGENVFIVQAKCWAKYKSIRENHIFQLYGSMAHYKIKNNNDNINAVFYTSAQYSDVAKEVASELGITLKTEKLNNLYPMVKCKFSEKGEKVYHLPVDPLYDKITINLNKGECFVQSVKEAVDMGFRWSQRK